MKSELFSACFQLCFYLTAVQVPYITLHPFENRQESKILFQTIHQNKSLAKVSIEAVRTSHWHGAERLEGSNNSIYITEEYSLLDSERKAVLS